MGITKAQFNPYFNYLPYDTQQKIIAGQLKAERIDTAIRGKWAWYKLKRSYDPTEEDLNRAARDISADLIREKIGASTEYVKKVLLEETFWARLKQKIKDTMPWYLKPQNLAIGAVLIYFGPGMLGRFLKARS